MPEAVPTTRTASAEHLTLVNEARVGSDGWIQLSPFGDFRNAGGIQRVQKEDADRIVDDFHDPLNLEARTLGLPFYIGHPDFPALERKYPDTRAYGRVKDLQTRHSPGCAKCAANDASDPCHEHGLFAKVKWGSQGKQIVDDEAFHGHSVNWRVETRGGFKRPTSLKSVGFTNDPQIPVAPVTVANEKDRKNMNTLLDWIKKLLGKPDLTEETAVNEMADYVNTRMPQVAADRAACVANESALATAAGVVKDFNFTVPDGVPMIVFLANEVAAGRTRETTLVNERTTGTTALETATAEVTRLKGELTAKDGEIATLKADKVTADTNLANTKRSRARILIDTAVAEGRITPAQVEVMVNEAVADFDGSQARIKALPARWTNKSRVGPLGAQDTVVKSRSEKVLTLVNERRVANRKAGVSDDYDVCYQQIQKEKPELFADMVQPAQPAKQ